MTNLINNAIKFTEPGGRISVSTERSPTSQEFVQVAVSDTGRAIPPDQVDLVLPDMDGADLLKEMRQELLTVA